MPTTERKIFTEEERRERKNARQREYAKRTNYAANNAYNKKTYTQIAISVRKEKALEYKKKCQKLGISYSQPLHEAIEKILNEKL